MDVYKIMMEQLSVIFNTRKDQIELLYSMCDKNYNRLISLQESLKKNHISYCPWSKKEVSDVLKLGKDNRYSYLRATIDPITKSYVRIEKKDKPAIMVPIPGLRDRARGYKHSVEQFTDGVWKKQTFFCARRLPPSHFSLCPIEGKQRNGACIEDTRVDRLSIDDEDDTFNYQINYKTEDKKPGLPVFIINGDLTLFNSLK